MPSPSHSTQEHKAQLAMFIAMLLSGTIGYCVINTGQAVNHVIFFRCLIGGALLALFVAYQGYFSKLKTLQTKQWLLLIGGALFLVANWYFLFSAYKRTSIGLSTVIYHLQPFFLLLGSALFYGTRFTKENIICILVAFLGLLIIAQADLVSFNLGSTYLVGCLFALCAALLYAATTLCTKALSQTLPTELIACLHMLLGLLVFSFMLDGQQLPQQVSQWGFLVLLGAVHTAIMYLILYYAFKHAHPMSLSTISYVYPAVALLIDYLAFDVSVHGTQWLGIALILTANLVYVKGWKFLGDKQ